MSVCLSKNIFKINLNSFNQSVFSRKKFHSYFHFHLFGQDASFSSPYSNPDTNVNTFAGVFPFDHLQRERSHPAMFAQDNAHVQNILHRNENVAFDTPQHRATTHYRRQQYVGHFVNIPDMRDSTNWKNPAESNLLYLDLDKMGKAMPSGRSRSYIDALPGSYTDQQSQSSIQSSEVGVHDNRRYCFGNNRFAPTSQEMRQPRRLREYVFLFSLFYHFISFPMLSSTCIKIYFLIIIFFYLDISDVYNT